MKLNVIIFKNLKVNAFTTPQFITEEPEIAGEQLARSLALNYEKDYDKLKSYEELQMFDLGTFDDVSGEVNFHKPTLILDCREHMLSLKQQVLAKKQAMIEAKEEVAHE